MSITPQRPPISGQFGHQSIRRTADQRANILYSIDQLNLAIHHKRPQSEIDRLRTDAERRIKETKRNH